MIPYDNEIQIAFMLGVAPWGIQDFPMNTLRGAFYVLPDHLAQSCTFFDLLVLMARAEPGSKSGKCGAKPLPLPHRCFA